MRRFTFFWKIVIFCRYFLFFSILAYNVYITIWRWSLLKIFRTWWERTRFLCNLLKRIDCFFRWRNKRLKFFNVSKIKSIFKNFWLCEINFIQKRIIKNSIWFLIVRIVFEVINGNAKSWHFENATGNIASFIFTLIKFVLWQHKILQLVCCIKGSRIFSWIWIRFKACSLILEILHHFNVWLTSLSKIGCKIFSIWIVHIFCLLNSLFNLLLCNWINEIDHLFRI